MIQNFINQWKNIDKISLLLTLLFIVLGMITLISISVSSPHHASYLSSYFPVCLIGALIILFLSFQSQIFIYRFSLIGLVISLIFTISMTSIASNWRFEPWISFFKISFFSSKFVVPFFIIFIAKFIADTENIPLASKKWKFFNYKKILIYLAFLFCFVTLLLANPSTSLLLFLVFFTLIFLAGMISLILILVSVILFTILTMLYLAAYMRVRISNFIDPTSGDSFQIFQSIKAYTSGGFFGKGPGQGDLIANLPDSHTTYVFSSIAEQFGLVGCIGILLLFLVFLLRGLFKVKKIDDKFIHLAISGLLAFLSLQIIFNISATLNFVPKSYIGLPFFGYDNSLMLSNCILIGLYLGVAKFK